MMRKINEVFSENDVREITSNQKFFASKKMDTNKLNIGLETLSYISQIENMMNKKKENNPKGLMKHFDLLDGFFDSNISTFKFIIELKNSLYGKDYVRKCCLYAIFRSYSNDIDIIPVLQNMHLDNKKKLKNKKGKSLK